DQDERQGLEAQGPGTAEPLYRDRPSLRGRRPDGTERPALSPPLNQGNAHGHAGPATGPFFPEQEAADPEPCEDPRLGHLAGSPGCLALWPAGGETSRAETRPGYSLDVRG